MTANPRWIEVSRTGRYEGYPGGGVSFTSAMFAELVRNFRAHPWYTPGADGIGTKAVVPFDYEHASEMHPTSGSIPVTGSPAPAWALDLEVRTSTVGATLWALTKLSPRALEQVRSGQYRSTSIAVNPNAVDSVTGKRVGAVLTSIAFTNHPFIRGMQPIAASMRGIAKRNHQMDATTMRARYPRAANLTMACISHLSETLSTFRSRSWSDQVLAAGQLARSLQAGGPASTGDTQPAVKRLQTELANLAPLIQEAMIEDELEARAALTSAQESGAHEAAVSAHQAKTPKAQAQAAHDAATAGKGVAASTLDLRGYHGRNRVEKTVAFLASTRPDFAALARDQQFFHAGQVLRTSSVVE